MQSNNRVPSPNKVLLPEALNLLSEASQELGIGEIKTHLGRGGNEAFESLDQASVNEESGNMAVSTDLFLAHTGVHF